LFHNFEVLESFVELFSKPKKWTGNILEYAQEKWFKFQVWKVNKVMWFKFVFPHSELDSKGLDIITHIGNEGSTAGVISGLSPGAGKAGEDS
jgi:hypothetical protein